ncbi:MAG: nuclear transport factor 2 family protein [Acidobacteria bacterium]|nr:nuclear transport factor 2 family protein [Acidobacteriota bacterium]
MKRLVTIFALLLLSSAMSMAQDANPATEQEIKRLLAAQDEATVKGDVAALRKLSTEDFTLATPIGSIVTKEAFLQSVESRQTVYEEHRTEDITLRVFGETTVARAVLKMKPVFNGQSRVVQMRATMVFVKVKGQWLLYTLHTSTIPPPRPAPPTTPPPTSSKPPGEL